MLPTLHARRFAASVLITAIISAGLAAAHWSNRAQSAAALLDQAERALRKNDPERAIHFQRLYLESRSSDAEILSRQARLLAEFPDPRLRDEAHVLYERLLMLQPDDLPAREALIGLSMMAGRYRDAQRHLEVAVGAYGPRAKWLCGLAACRWAALDIAGARRNYESALELEGDSAEAARGLFDIAFSQKDRTAMESALCRLGGSAPDDPQTELRAKQFEQFTSR